MGKDLLKLPEGKKGFLLLLALEALAAAWSLAAMLYAVRSGRTSTMIYGGVTVFAIFYILGRSLRSFRSIVRREREEAAETEKDGKE